LQDATSILAAVTVRRVGLPQETAPLHRTELGRVLVTIDDLAALMTLLTDDTPELHIEFDGGYFTEAEELRTLSDIEVRSLRLQTPEVQVVLNSSDAFAVGERQEAEDVYRLWARARKTQLRPLPIPLSDYIIILMPTVLMLSFVLRILSQVDTVSLTAAYELYIYAGAVGASGPVMSVGIWYIALARRSSYAVVIPLSIDEYRQNRLNQTYPRRIWIVTIVSAIITVISVGVLIWSKVTSP